MVAETVLSFFMHMADGDRKHPCVPYPVSTISAAIPADMFEGTFSVQMCILYLGLVFVFHALAWPIFGNAKFVWKYVVQPYQQILQPLF